jgi:hypothetical protein
MKIRFGFSASANAIASLLLQALMSNLCYIQTRDLKRVFIVFHNKNFFLHWVFQQVSGSEPNRFSYTFATVFWLKYSAIPRSISRLFRRRPIVSVTTRTSKNPATTARVTSK